MSDRTILRDKATCNSAIGLSFTVDRRMLWRMIRMLNRRTPAGIRRSAMHSEYRRRRNRR